MSVTSMDEGNKRIVGKEEETERRKRKMID